MALTLGLQKTFIDEAGNSYDKPYLVIDQVNGNKQKKEQYFVVEVYKDVTCRKSRMKPVYKISYTVAGDEWEEFFSPKVITEDSDQYSRAYEYIKQFRPISYITKIDDDGVSTTMEVYGDYIYKDWKNA